MRSLSWKLAGSLLLIVILSVGLMAYLANVAVTREFGQYLNQGEAKLLQNIGQALGGVYDTEGGWDGVQTVLDGYLRSANDRLVLADASGVIVADTEDALVGQTADSQGLSGGTAVAASSGTVGQVYLLSVQNGVGKGYKGGKGNSSAVVSTAGMEQDFLDRFNNSLLITGLIVAALAIIIGLVLTRQITRPLRALVNGVRQITRGNLKHRVTVNTKDELADLGRSFNTMAEGLDKAEEERKRIVADIAHDLRTPLTVIEGTVTGIEDGVFQADKQHLDAIREQTALLTRLTGDLRELSLAESGQLKLSLAPLDMAGLVRRQAAQYEIRAREKDIEIVTDLPEGLPSVNADAARVEQVLGNLITNAINYTPSAGKVTVALKLSGKDPSHGIDTTALVLSVADTGEGIAPEHLPHIFERFYRTEKSRVRNAGGSGLGLAIVKQMVQAHGGRVWVESEVGKGSTFYAALPVG